MYVVTSIPLVRRTRATFRRAEFGFFGVVVYTRVQTPRFCGEESSAGLAVLTRTRSRPSRTNREIVGTDSPVTPGPRRRGRARDRPQTAFTRPGGPLRGAPR